MVRAFPDIHEVGREAPLAHATCVFGYMSLAIILTGILVAIGTGSSCAVFFLVVPSIKKIAVAAHIKHPEVQPVGHFYFSGTLRVSTSLTIPKSPPWKPETSKICHCSSIVSSAGVRISFGFVWHRAYCFFNLQAYHTTLN